MGRWVFGLRRDRRLVVDLGHRLGRRPQLHRLRAAARRLRRRSPTRARSTIPTPRPFWRIIDENRVTGIFTSPTAVRLLMRYGEERAGALRPLAPSSASSAPARCSTRRPGSGSRRGLRRPHPGHRPHVADRDGRPDLRQSVRHRAAADQARLGRHAAARASRRRSSTPRASELPPRREGDHRHPAAVPRPDADACGASRSATSATTGARIPGVVLHRRRGRDRRGRLRLVRAAAPTRSSRSRRTGIGTIEVETAFLRHPAVAEAGVTGRPDELRGEVIAAFVVLQAGPRAVRRSSPRSCSRRVRSELGAGGRARRAQLRRHAAEDPQRQDHAPRPQGRRARAATRATSPPSRTRARSRRRARPWRRCGRRSQPRAERQLATLGRRPRPPTDTKLRLATLYCATIRSCRDLIQAHHRDVYAAAAPPRGGWGPRSLQLMG